MGTQTKYRAIFTFKEDVPVSIRCIDSVLIQVGERTFESVEDGIWFHKKYGSQINWFQDPKKNVLIATVQKGESVRTCGSLVEWMLRNGDKYLNDVEQDLTRVIVEAFSD